MNVIRAFIRNRRELDIDASQSIRLPLEDSLTDKGKMHKLRTSKAESTDAITSVGPSNMSDEVFVMKMEQRAWVIQVFKFQQSH
jgi:hypothetical protein